MQDIRTRLIVMVGIPLLVIILLIAFALVWQNREVEQVVPDTTTPTVTDSVTDDTTRPDETPYEAPGIDAPLPDLPTPEVTPMAEQAGPELFAKQTARIFVERFGSYSNQNDNVHLEDVAKLSTAKMQEWLVTQRITSTPNAAYEGVTTKVIASSLRTYSDSNATVVVNVQQEITDSSGTRLEQRDGRIEMVRSGSDWLVDGFFWE